MVAFSDLSHNYRGRRRSSSRRSACSYRATQDPPSLLYHFTAPTTSHLGSILASKQIRLTESNVSCVREHVGPDVVWLTDSRDRSHQLWSQGAPAAELKLQAVLCVAIPSERLHHWPEWSRAQGIDDSAYEGLADSGGDPDRWWVTTEPVEHRHIAGLALLPYLRPNGTVQTYRMIAGDELELLFRSAEARETLNLLPTRRTVWPGSA